MERDFIFSKITSFRARELCLHFNENSDCFFLFPPRTKLGLGWTTPAEIRKRPSKRTSTHTHTHTHTHTEREREKPLSPSFACDKFACRNAGGAVPVTSPAGSVSVRWWVRFFFKHIFFRFFVSFSSPHFTRNQSRCFTKRNSDPYISPFVFVCLFVCFSLALATEDVANVQWNRLEFFEKKNNFC